MYHGQLGQEQDGWFTRVTQFTRGLVSALPQPPTPAQRAAMEAAALRAPAPTAAAPMWITPALVVGGLGLGALALVALGRRR